MSTHLHRDIDASARPSDAADDAAGFVWTGFTGTDPRKSAPTPRSPLTLPPSSGIRDNGVGETTVPLQPVRTGWKPAPQTQQQRQAPEGRRLRLSIVVPAYNEQATIGAVLRALLSIDAMFDFEVIVVDDGSSDETLTIAESIKDSRLTVLQHTSNRGKGEALRTGIMVATGTHFLPFDADSEYEPTDIPRLMEPVLRGRTDVVYGARIAGINTRYTSFWYPLGSWATTLAANVLFASRLKDLHTCLKLLPLDVMREMSFRESRFGLDTEMTARFLKMGLRPFEIPVSYHGRSKEEGKKIRWQDGVRCLMVLVRVKLSSSASSKPPTAAPGVPASLAGHGESSAAGVDPGDAGHA